MITEELRAEVRALYDYRCGYCGVREEDVGGELEIDHFCPRSAGGGDDLDNLVYACARCNRYKAAFWPADNPALSVRRLLHPRQDDFSRHLREEEDGRLMALSATGAFHLRRLRLNRPQLMAFRLNRRAEHEKELALQAARQEKERIRRMIAAAEERLQQILDEIDRLMKA